MINTMKLSAPDHQVNIGSGSLRSLKDYKCSKVFVLIDNNTREHCLPIFFDKCGIPEDSVDLIEITSGEQYKTLGTCKYIWESLMENGADRGSLLINLGGGVITDIGGFSASCFKRGIKFINIPTTLMAQVDAAIGGKTGVNLDHLKNQIGVFNNPEAIFIDTDFLETLPEEHILSGFAEVLKYGLISDKVLWDKLADFDIINKIDWYDIIVPAVKIKIDFVEKDPNEQNLRKILNFGHTVGHALETLSYRNNTPCYHGEAVAVGLVVESIISSKVLGLDKNITQDIFDVVNSNFLLPQFAKNDITEIVNLMVHDKKNVEGRINFTLLEKIGKSIIDQFCPIEIIEESLVHYYTILSHAETQNR